MPSSEPMVANMFLEGLPLARSGNGFLGDISLVITTLSSLSLLRLPS